MVPIALIILLIAFVLMVRSNFWGVLAASLISAAASSGASMYSASKGREAAEKRFESKMAWRQAQYEEKQRILKEKAQRRRQQIMRKAGVQGHQAGQKLVSSGLSGTGVEDAAMRAIGEQKERALETNRAELEAQLKGLTPNPPNYRGPDLSEEYAQIGKSLGKAGGEVTEAAVDYFSEPEQSTTIPGGQTTMETATEQLKPLGNAVASWWGSGGQEAVNPAGGWGSVWGNIWSGGASSGGSTGG